jgi:hypothetical protein
VCSTEDFEVYQTNLQHEYPRTREKRCNCWQGRLQRSTSYEGKERRGYGRERTLCRQRYCRRYTSNASGCRKEATTTPGQWKPAQKGTAPPTNPAMVGQARATIAAKNAARNPVFLGGRYAINAYVWRTADQNAEAAGSVLSQSLDKSILSRAPDKYAGDISLGQLRKLTPGWCRCLCVSGFITDDLQA